MADGGGGGGGGEEMERQRQTTQRGGGGGGGGEKRQTQRYTQTKTERRDSLCKGGGRDRHTNTHRPRQKTRFTLYLKHATLASARVRTP